MLTCITMLLGSQGLTVFAAEVEREAEAVEEVENAGNDETIEADPKLAAEEGQNKDEGNFNDFEINGTTLIKYKGNKKDVVIPDCITEIGT